ncbi:hypothetical protein [Caproiciproducens galactitolivorans]|uniref:Uncharacterized protein n=1 Tax=Caproiciproducens galactitolivorans TaxID=642589 RepID=A0ABT4BY67_9FIRM|nr:hypothetical protein [Caproiciproducens galactitolivorans]MCY1714983.1 hypothetical protein [Caproiciproducens galactitolivorans]
MRYLYAAMWFAAGLILIFRMGRENRIFYFAGAFFLFLGGWWLAFAAGAANLFAGVWGWVFRVITAAALALFCFAYYKEVKRKKAEAPDEEDPGEDE